MVGGRALQSLTGGVGSMVGVWLGGTKRAVAGSEDVSTGESKGGRNARMVYSCACRDGLAVSYEEADKPLALS